MNSVNQEQFYKGTSDKRRGTFILECVENDNNNNNKVTADLIRGKKERQ